MRSGVIMPRPPAADRSRANASTPSASTGFQYVMTTARPPASLTASTARNESRTRTPPRSAVSLAFAIVGPPIPGSEDGIPTSTMSQPDSTNVVIASMDVGTSGYPVGRYPISADRSCWWHEAKSFVSRAPSTTRSILVIKQSEPFRRGCDILVAAPRQVYHDDPSPADLGGQRQGARHRMRRLDRRNDALGAAQQLERVHCLGVRDRSVLGATEVLQQSVLGADARIVQSCGNGMAFDGLPVLTLQQVGERSLEGAGRATCERRGVPAGFDTITRRLETHQANARIIDESVEDPDRICPSAHAGSHGVRQSTCLRHDLRARLQTDHALKVADHHRERMRTRRRA